MKVGDKIKKYRLLNDLTQNELGQKIGFSSQTADSRIRKYESNSMSPKSKLRQKIADALNVDKTALSDIDIKDEKDIMQILFFLEENYGMEVVKIRKTVYFTFRKNKMNRYIIDNLLQYLNSWYNANLHFQKKCKKCSEANNEYLLWKGRFPKEADQFITSNHNIHNSISLSGYVSDFQFMDCQYKFDLFDEDEMRVIPVSVECDNILGRELSDYFIDNMFVTVNGVYYGTKHNSDGQAIIIANSIELETGIVLPLKKRSE